MYIMYMALHITNNEAERAVRELAGATGESMTDAIGTAARERLARLQLSSRKPANPTVAEIVQLVRSYKLTPIGDDLTEDEILGYGLDGIPE